MNAKLVKGVRPPNGTYEGTWSAYIIEIEYKGETLEFETEIGMRGVDIAATVTISNKEITCDYEDED